ncbi:MAG: LLM class flavin-dependent oxidoreductase [Acidimicrobiales bacterium]
MQIGLSAASHTVLDPSAGAAHLLARVRAARDADLASLSFGDQHNVAGDSYFQNTPTLGRALADWTGRPAGCLFLLPLWHPVLVAEHVGTLAALHDGPFILQTGLGSGDQQFAGMGQDLAERATRFEEAARMIRALLDGESVSSERFGVTDAAIGLQPATPVEWWIGAAAPVGLRRAARMGDAWYTGPGYTPTTIAEPLALYREACDREGRTPRVMVRLDATVSHDPSILQAAREQVGRGYRGMSEAQLIIGTPDEAVAQLAPFAELGVDQIVVRSMGVSPEADLETISGLADVRASFAEA